MSVFSSLFKFKFMSDHHIAASGAKAPPADKEQLDAAQKRLEKNKSDLNKATDELSAMINRMKRSRRKTHG